MLIGHLAGIRQRCFPGPRILSSVYDRIIEILGRPCDRLEVAEARTKLLDLLFMVLHASRTMKAESRSPLVNRAVKLMEERVQDRFSLPKIAAQLGVSLSHFQHRFRRETGIAPAEFLLRRKISEACSRLRRRDAGSITQIALGLGFSSSDYFATAFKRITGLTPLEFRKTQD